jgi:hypothetical protein
MKTGQFYTIEEIIGLLHDKAEDLAAALLGGRKEGGEWRAGSRRKSGGIGDSLSVNLDSRRGYWFHGKTGRAGRDMLSLIAYVHGLEAADTVAWAKDWLGLEHVDPAELRQRNAERRVENDKADARRRAAAAEAKRRAVALFTSAQQKIAGTPVELYLAERGLELRQLPRQPGALRFHPSLTYRDRAAGTSQRFPAMLALVTDARTGTPLTVHRTWLAQLDGVWRKAPVAEPKKTYSRYAGGIIQIWRGASARPIRDGAPGGDVIVSEGIEDALAVALAVPTACVVSAVSLGNMARLDFPPHITSVRIAGQNDAPGSKAAADVEAAAQHFRDDGRVVQIIRPPARFKDWAQIAERVAERRRGEARA